MQAQSWQELERAALSEAVSVYGHQDLFDLWFSMRGRASRYDYWVRYVLPLLILNGITMLIDTVTGTMTPLGVGFLSGMLAIVGLWPALAVTVKRLHDLGYSGWFVPTLYGGMIGAGVFAAVLLPVLGDVGVLLFVPLAAIALFGLWVSLRMAFARGTLGPNEYGPDPVG